MPPRNPRAAPANRLTAAAPKAKAGKAKKRDPNAKFTLTPTDPTRPIGRGNPPREYAFKPGNQAAAGHGRPQTLADLQALIKETLAEDITDEQGRALMTRAQMMMRTMLIKSPSDRIALLEYAFGKVPQAITVEDVTNKPDSELIREFESLLDAARARAGDDAGGGTPAAGASTDGGSQ